MEKWKKRTALLITSLIFGGRGDAAVVPYYPQKTAIGGRDGDFFARTVPEKMGISSRRIYNMLCELEGERRANVHSLLVLCDGQVICECSAHGYDTHEWHVSHSMSKTVLGMVIGTLVEKGMLSTDMRLVDIMPEMEYRDKRFNLITIDHLLSMRTGVDFAEIGSITESDWTAAYFSSSLQFAPGTKFSYNSMNSYILARVAERVSGKGFGSLAEEYIFAPLGISNYFWEKGPEGTEKGGWGLYMSAESWAKVGCMLLNGGEWGKKRILSSEWVRESSITRSFTPEESESFNYGYHLWISRGGDELLFNGMLGQNVWICPKNKIVVVVTSGNNELFQDSPTLQIIRKHLAGEIKDDLDYRSIRLLSEKQASFMKCRRWVRPLERGRGILYLLGVRKSEPIDPIWNALLGRYTVVDNEVGIIPLVVRLMQNNLDVSIKEIYLYRRREELRIQVIENRESYDFAIGLYQYSRDVINVRGEKYILHSMGEAVRVAGGGVEYRIELILPETASTRMLVIRPLEGGKIEITFSERPNHRLALALLKRYRDSNGVVSFVADAVEKRIGREEMERGVERSFRRQLMAVSRDAEDYEAIMERARAVSPSESGGVKIIRAIIDRLFGER
ncbi:MAG: serine hydrolase [Clostridia bacterium]|nr:serine hydrolase [Clostridia bacterium]